MFMLISILEDDALHLQLLSRWLLKTGKYQITTFNTPEEFFEAKQNARVVVLDAFMAGSMSDGLIARIRRQSGEAGCVGIILASSLPDPQNASFVEECDIDAFLNKDHISQTGLEIAITLAARSAARRRQSLLRT